jgi:hypothetical protein
MPRPAVTVALLLLAVAGLAAAGETGRLQVTCRSGVRVYLDGEFVGLTTAEEDGLYLREVSGGGHLVRVEKLGFEPQELEVEVRPGRATEVRVDPLTPTRTEAAPLPTPTETPAPTPPPTAVPARPPVATPAAKSTAPPPTPAPSPSSAPPVAAAPATVAAEPTQAPTPPPATPTRLPPSAAVVLPATAVAVAPAVVAVPDEPTAAPPPPTPPTPTPVAAVPTVVLTRSSKPTSNVAFAYRASGAGAAEGRSVAIWRERGGPKAPILILTCSDGAGCEQQTSPRFPPGAYRFRVVFTRTLGESSKVTVLFRHEVAVEVETSSDTAYLVEAVYGGDDPGLCTAAVREVRLVQGEG